MLRIRRGTVTLALATAVTSVSLTAPAVLAEPASEVDRLVLGVGADETSANLNWTTPGIAEEFVQFAPASAMTSDAFPAESATTVDARRGQIVTIRGGRYPMSAEITGLKEDTEYVYRVGSDTRGWTDAYTFDTGTFADNWEFTFFGDPQLGASQTGLPSGREADGASWAATTAAVEQRHPDSSLWLSAGDQIDFTLDSQTQQAEYDFFFAPDELRENRFVANRGNHDISKAYSESFNLPNSTATGTQPHNYFFEYNNALVVALDTNTVTKQQLEEQKRFLRSTVEQHGGDKDWVVVTYHHSTYSQAYHQTDAIVQSYRNEGMVDLLSELGVDLVLSGHDHIHTRSHLMRGNTPVVPEGTTGPGDVLNPKDGEVLYVTATSSSGSKFYDFAVDESVGYTEYEDITTKADSDAAGLTAPSTAFWVQDETPDYTQISVTPEALTLTTRNVADDSLVDEVTLNRADPASPASPSSLSSRLSS